MKIFKSKHKLQKEILNIKNISFVPTMGGLHQGHISLIKKAKILKTRTLVSIFINPKQFNKKKDFTSYPRNIKKDLKILKNLKTDYVYLPTYNEVFNFKTKNKVFLDKFSKELCGKNRKGHFEGVLNVVNRLLEIIKPKYIILGLKDYQQMSLIKQHIIKRKIETILIECKIIRNNNGVAYSTRNKNINKNQFKIASRVYKYLKYKKKKIKSKIIYFDTLIYKKELMNLGVEKIDYLELYNMKTLKKPKHTKEKFNLFIAYYLNKVRLIDNI